MKAFCAEDCAFEDVAARLNAEGIGARTNGKRWFGMAVSRILKAQDALNAGRR